MATTPLIKTPQAQGGTFYTFSSAAKDLSKTLNNDNLKLVFSKFVLLNLPDFDRLDPTHLVIMKTICSLILSMV